MVLFIVWLHGRGQRDLTRYCTVYFQKQSLSGLQVDSYVTMRGIRVGSVESLKIQPTDIERVAVTILVSKDTPVKEDTRAVIQRNLLTGLASIDLVNSSQNSPELLRIPAGESYPVIPEGQGGLEQIKDTLPELLDRVSALAQNIGALFAGENGAHLAATLKNVENATAQLAQVQGSVDSAIKQVSVLALEMQDLARELKDSSREATLALKTGSDVISRSSANVALDLSSAMEKLANTIERFENPRSLLVGPDSTTLGPGESAR